MLSSGEPMVLAMLAEVRPVTDTMSPAPMAARSMRPSPERFHSFVRRPSSTKSPACVGASRHDLLREELLRETAGMRSGPSPFQLQALSGRTFKCQEAKPAWEAYRTSMSHKGRGAASRHEDRQRREEITCVVQHSDAVAHLGLARCHAAGGDAAQEAVVLHHGHQHGEGVRGAVRRRGYVPDDGVQQGLHRRVVGRAARLGQHTVRPSLQHTLLGLAQMGMYIKQRPTCNRSGLDRHSTDESGFNALAHQRTWSFAELPVSAKGKRSEIPGLITRPLLSRYTCLADA